MRINTSFSRGSSAPALDFFFYKWDSGTVRSSLRRTSENDVTILEYGFKMEIGALPSEGGFFFSIIEERLSVSTAPRLISHILLFLFE